MIPRKMKIKGNDWTIKKQKEVKDDDGNECLGLCVYEHRKILLEKGMEKSEEIEIFFHELLHAILHEVHLDIGRQADEMLVEALTQEIFKNFNVKIKKGP
jgi:Zn-dependent peptidase ImmA (M78 family)